MSTDATAIRDAAFNRVKDLPAFKSARRTPMYTLDPEWLPLLSVYLLREQWKSPDAVTGPPEFVHTLSLGLSGLMAWSNDETAELELDAAMTAVETALLVDDGRSSNTFLRLVEGVQSLDRQTVYSRDGETPIVEMRLQVDVVYRTMWPPVVSDDFDRIHVTARPVLKPSDFDKDWSKIQTADQEYDIPQD